MYRIYSCDTPIQINGQTHFIIKTSNVIVDIYGYIVQTKMKDLRFTERMYTDRYGYINSYTTFMPA